MNERIKELYSQAVQYTMDNAGRKGQASSDRMCAEKFAELIVRECANIATINAHQWETPGTHVLKYFGVKE